MTYLNALKIYNYSPVTGEYVSAGAADIDPLDANNILIPAYATTTPPPELDEAHSTAVFKDGAWEIVPDYRGFRVPVLDKVVTITSLGEIPDDHKPSAEAQRQFEKEKALQDVMQSRETEYAALGWNTPFDLIEDIMERGMDAIKADRQAVKKRNPKPKKDA